MEHMATTQLQWGQVTIAPEWIEIPPKIVTVYIAGPYTNGDTERNVQGAIEVADHLFGLGYMPFVPHLSHYWHLHRPRSYEQWMQWCCVWLARCDAVLRLEGESKGADDEVALAAEFGLPVFHSIEELWAMV
jgi:hypothetical protein